MRVDFVDGDTWVGLYFDCVLVTEGHSISPWEVIQLLAQKDRKVEMGDFWEASGDWLYTVGNFPTRLEDVVVFNCDDLKTIKEVWDLEQD